MKLIRFEFESRAKITIEKPTIIQQKFWIAVGTIGKSIFYRSTINRKNVKWYKMNAKQIKEKIDKVW